MKKVFVIVLSLIVGSGCQSYPQAKDSQHKIIRKAWQTDFKDLSKEEQALLLSLREQHLLLKRKSHMFLEKNHREELGKHLEDLQITFQDSYTKKERTLFPVLKKYYEVLLKSAQQTEKIEALRINVEGAKKRYMFYMKRHEEQKAKNEKIKKEYERKKKLKETVK